MSSDCTCNSHGDSQQLHNTQDQSALISPSLSLIPSLAYVLYSASRCSSSLLSQHQALRSDPELVTQPQTSSEITHHWLNANSFLSETSGAIWCQAFALIFIPCSWVACQFDAKLMNSVLLSNSLANLLHAMQTFSDFCTILRTLLATALYQLCS